jgi:hypothetical protein
MEAAGSTVAARQFVANYEAEMLYKDTCIMDVLVEGSKFRHLGNRVRHLGHFGVVDSP